MVVVTYLQNNSSEKNFKLQRSLAEWVKFFQVTYEYKCGIQDSISISDLKFLMRE